MESGSQAGDPGERIPGEHIPGERLVQPLANPLATVMGTVIALLTLAVPIAAIAHFSSADSTRLPPPVEVFSQQE